MKHFSKKCAVSLVLCALMLCSSCGNSAESTTSSNAETTSAPASEITLSSENTTGAAETADTAEEISVEELSEEVGDRETILKATTSDFEEKYRDKLSAVVDYIVQGYDAHKWLDYFIPDDKTQITSVMYQEDEENFSVQGVIFDNSGNMTDLLFAVFSMAPTADDCTVSKDYDFSISVSDDEESDLSQFESGILDNGNAYAMKYVVAPKDTALFKQMHDAVLANADENNTEYQTYKGFAQQSLAMLDGMTDLGESIADGIDQSINDWEKISDAMDHFQDKYEPLINAVIDTIVSDYGNHKSEERIISDDNTNITVFSYDPELNVYEFDIYIFDENGRLTDAVPGHYSRSTDPEKLGFDIENNPYESSISSGRVDDVYDSLCYDLYPDGTSMLEAIREEHNPDGATTDLEAFR